MANLIPGHPDSDGENHAESEDPVEEEAAVGEDGGVVEGGFGNGGFPEVIVESGEARHGGLLS